MKLIKIGFYLLFSFSFYITKAQLSGTYTIGGTSPDFANLTDVIDTLNSKGVKGPVTFHIRSGTYNEQLYLKKISGISASDSILFTAAPGSTTMPELIYAPTGPSLNFSLRLTDVEYVTIKRIHFNTGGTTYGTVLLLTGNTHHLVFDSCIFSGSRTPSTSGNNSVILQGSGARDSVQHCTFKNSEILYGSIAFDWQGNTQYHEDGNRIENCKFLGFYYWGIKAYYQHNFACIGNYLKDTSISNQMYVIRHRFSSGKTQILNNQLISEASNSVFLLDVGPLDNSDSADLSLICNNFCVQLRSSVQKHAYGIHVSSTSNLLLAHNTVLINASVNTNFDARALNFDASYTTAYGNVKVYNNCIVNKGNGVAVCFESSATNIGMVSKMDHNNLFTNGSIFGAHINHLNTFADWQKNTSFDGNSISVEPNFVSSEDLHTDQLDLNRAGLGLKEVTTDIDGEQRNSQYPDIGADEFSVAKNDMSLATVYPLNSPGCASENSYVEVLIHNLGEDAQSNFPVKCLPKGGTAFVDTFRNTIKSNEKALFKIRGLDSRIDTLIQVTVFSSLSADQNTLNDTLRTELKFKPEIKIPRALPDTVCRNNLAILTADHVKGTTLNWYVNDSSAKPISTKETFFINKIQQDTQLWVSSFQESFKDSLFVSHAPNTGCAGGIMFDLLPHRDLVLQGFNTLFNKTGGQGVAVYLKHGSHKGHETDPSKWTFLDSMFINVPSTFAYVPLNFGLNLSLNGDSVYGIYLKGDLQYWEISGITGNSHMSYQSGSGLCSNFGNVEKDKVMNGWVVYNRDLPCESNRVKVMAIVKDVPAASLGMDTTYCNQKSALLSVSGDSLEAGYSWSTMESARSILVTQSGKYWVTVKTEHCGTASDTIQVQLLSDPDVSLPPDTLYCDSIRIYLDAGNENNGVRYAWNTLDTAQKIFVEEKGIYQVIVSNACGSDTATTVIHKLYSPEKTILPPDTTYCQSFNLNLKIGNSQNEETYEWYDLKTSKVLGTGDTLRRTSAGAISASISNGCGSVKDTLVIKHLSAPVIHLDSIYDACENISLNLEIGSPGNDEKYLWSTSDTSAGINTSAAGEYWVKASNYCGIDSVNFEIVLYPKPTSNFTTSDICEGQDYKFINQSIGGNTYEWRFGDGTISFDSSPVHRYEVTRNSRTYLVTLNAISSPNCKDSLSLAINIKATSDPSFVHSSQGNKIFFTQITDDENFQYNWDFGDGNGSTSVNPMHEYAMDSGSYEVCLKIRNAENCESEFCKMVHFNVGKWELPSSLFSIYPNPTRDILTIRFNQTPENASVVVRNLIGETLLEWNQIRSKEMSMDLSELGPGIYLIQVQFSGKLAYQKVHILR